MGTMPKFRVWLKEGECIKDVHSINFEEETVQCIENTIFIRTDSFEDVVLMQSTGLCDKRGNEILEGDIVKNSYGEIGYIKHSIYTFVFAKKKECEWREFYLHGIGAGSPFEVLGNIHEHSYLLEWR